MAKLRKALIAGVGAITVLSMSMLMVPMQVGAAAQAGDLIKMNGLSSVYYLGADNKRYVFPNESTYFSWYNDFSGVVTVPQSELESYPLGKNITVRPGTKLVKITTDPKVYAVLPNGNLQWVADEATAKTLWGDNWAKRVIDVPDAFFTNYIVASGQVSATAYPAGSLVKFGTAADVYYINTDGTASKIADEATFTANRFNWNNVVTATIAQPTAGTAISGANATIIDTSSGAGGNAAAGTGLTVSLSSATPASVTVPSLATGVVFTKINLTAANDGAVTVKDLTVKRTGIGASTEINKVYIYDGATRLTTGKAVNSTSNTVTFNSINVVVAAGTTKTLSIVADITTGSTGNHLLGIVASSDIVTDGAVVSGSFPVNGNTMALSATAVAALTSAQNNGTTATNIKIGQDGIEIADFDFDNSSVEDVSLSGITLTNGGNALAGDLGNINLYYDGKSIATGVLSNGKITFAFTPVTIEKGENNVNFKVLADIESGISNTVKLYISQKTDVTAVGKTYGYNANQIITAFDASSEAYPLTIQGGEITVNYKTDNAETVIADQKNFVFATMEVTVPEDVNVSEMEVTVDETDGDSSTGVEDIDELNIRNTTTGEVIDGTIVSGDGDAVITDVLWKFENFTWNKGSQVWEIRADIASGADATDAYEVDINFSSNFAARYTSSNEDVAVATDMSASTLSGKTKTIGGSSLTVTPSPFNAGDAVAKSTGVAIAGGKLSAGSVSAVTVSEMSFAGNNDTTVTGALVAGDVAYFDKTNVGVVYLQINGETVSSKNAASLTDGAVTFNNFSKTVTVPKSGDVTFAVVLDVAGTLDSTNLTVNLELTSVTARDANNQSVSAANSSGTAVDSTHRVDFGRVVTLRASGKLTVSMDNTVTDVDAAKYILAGTNGKKLARLKLKAEYEDIKIKRIYVYNNDADANDSSNEMHITKEDGTIVASEGVLVGNASSTAPFNNDNGLFTVPMGTSYYFVTVDTKNIGTGGLETADSGDYYEVLAGYISAQGASGNDLSAANIVYSGTGSVDGDASTDKTATSNKSTLTGVRISALEDDSASLNLATGEQTVGRIKVTAEAGVNHNASTGDVLKGSVKTLKTTVNFRYSSNVSTVTTSTALKLYREGKSGYITASALTDSGDELTFDLTNTSNGTGWAASNYEVDNGTTAVFYVKAAINAADTNDYVQLKLANLDTDSSANAVAWSDGVTATMYPLYLGKTELTLDTVN